MTIPACAIAPTHTQTQVMRMRLQWTKNKADGGCEKLPRYFKMRGEDKNMFLSASGRNRGHRRDEGQMYNTILPYFNKFDI